MTPEQFDKLLQPLFTTKARGIGAGGDEFDLVNGGTVEVGNDSIRQGDHFYR